MSAGDDSVNRYNTMGIREFELKAFDENDPLVAKVGWQPIEPGGTGFANESLIRSDGRILVRKTVGYRLYMVLVLLVGVFLVIGGSFMYLREKEYQWVWGGVLGVGCFFYAIRRLIWGMETMVFDGLSGIYYRGTRKGERSSLDLPDVERGGKLSSIHALQIVAEVIRTGGRHSSEYTSYELNLVLNDGSRVNVMDHANDWVIEESAVTLGEFLGVPVWKKQ